MSDEGKERVAKPNVVAEIIECFRHGRFEGIECPSCLAEGRATVGEIVDEEC